MKLISKEEISKISFNVLQSWRLYLISFKFDNEFFIGTIIDRFNNKFWYKNGKCHRDNGPAIEYSNGTKIWYKEDNLHRLDGPAVERSNGDKLWYIKGIKYSKSEFELKKISKVLI